MGFWPWVDLRALTTQGPWWSRVRLSACAPPRESGSVNGEHGQGPARATAAALVVASRLSGSPLGRLPENVRPPDELAGYAVQQCAHALLERGGFGRLAGWKIGCTTATMQEYLGVLGPCAGGMFQANVWRGSHEFVVPPNRRLGAECEVAVRIGADLTGGAGPYDLADATRSVAACMAAIEVVEDRYDDYLSIDAPTLIADDFFHHSCVLGPELEDFGPRGLRDTTGTMFVDGERVGSGRGDEVMGDPLTALTWLANGCVAWGAPLLAGDIVLLGSVVQPYWVVAEAEVTVVNDQLGEVRASFKRA
jgi:2-keto-4-pentenoate hydratase